MKQILKNQSGFSILFTIIIAAILGGAITAYMQITKVQNKTAGNLQLTISRLDLEKTLNNTLANGLVCSFLLNDSSQSSTASLINRSKDFIDSTHTKNDSPWTININRVLASPSADAPVVAEINKPASANSSKLLVSNMSFIIRPHIPPDVFIADFQVEFAASPGGRKMKNILIKNIQIATDSTTPAEEKKIIGCSGIGEPRAQRFSFTATSNWTVPEGVRKIFVTMAGGGGSGLGWRIISTLMTGSSGGYIFSHPLNVVPGEVLQVIVGKGGKGFSVINSGVLASPGAPYYIYTNPADDNGLGGYPGESSKIISATRGDLLECAGGSGATVGGVDNYGGAKVAGDLPGAMTGSGSPTSSSPNRAASGPYATAGGPGKCGPGPAGYGLGNKGISLWGINSGSYYGGRSPFGYGSGGNVWVSGCYVNATTTGTCISTSNGRDGVVFIDVW